MSSVFELDDDVAVVTGAFGRLGPVWMEALLEAGARVAALDLPGAGETQRFRALSAATSHDRLQRFECDVTDRRSLEVVRAQLVDRWGPPSVLVNNAGLDQPPDSAATRHTIDDVPIDVVRRMLDVNLTGAFQVIQIMGSLMAEHGRGSVINIGSLYASVSPDQRLYDHLEGTQPFLKTPVYGASKAGLVNLTKSFATLWGTRGVRVNALSPGGVLGEQDEIFRRKYCERVPLGRMANPEDLKGPLVFLASKASAYVTGIELRVDGGFTAW
jgi:NAD(P)-dependent dehydrogenase (short-subunit alcohol dehydrogenase family)